MAAVKTFNKYKFVGVGFSFGGMLFVVIGIILYVTNSNFLESAIETTAVITNISSYPHPMDADKEIHEVGIVYVLDRQPYRTILNEYDIKWQVGTKIVLYVNPENPLDVRSSVRKNIGMFFIPLGGIFAIIGFGILIGGRKRVLKYDELLRTGIRLDCPIKNVFYDFSVNLFGRHPYMIGCEWIDPETGVTYQFKSSTALIQNPSKILQKYNIHTLPVYIDPNNKKHYFMDISEITNPPFGIQEDAK